MKQIPPNNNEKHLAFLLDCPNTGEIMLFPGWFEDLNFDNYEEVTEEVTLNIKIRKSMAGFKYKIFKRKT